MSSISIEDALKAGTNCAVIITDHATFDYAAIAAKFPLIVDSRNALKGLTSPNVFPL